MRVIIATANQEILKGVEPELVFKKFTKNTSTFITDETTFNEICKKLKSQKYNIYALMSW